jgi:Ser/Thr protein kinase RdoA (MazF antagonist)
MRLADIVRRFSVDPDAVWLIKKRYNTHWLVRAGARRYVLRRFGSWMEADREQTWEVGVLRQLAAAGLPVAAPIGEPQWIDGELYALMPFLHGRALGHGNVSDAAYRKLGRALAEVHAVVASLPAPPQRPGWTANVDGALPLTGGATYRAELLSALAAVDPAMAARFSDAAQALEARDLPSVFAAAPRMIVHGDFSPWNVRFAGGRMAALLDFDLAHVDVRAADVAFARRGYHDAVVDGYLEVAGLSDAELAALDGLWLGGVLSAVWRVMENRIGLGEVTTPRIRVELGAARQDPALQGLARYRSPRCHPGKRAALIRDRGRRRRPGRSRLCAALARGLAGMTTGVGSAALRYQMRTRSAGAR